MSQPPNSIPEQPAIRRSSRYQRPRRMLSLWGIVIGIALGIGGGLYAAWILFPVVETSTRPEQLRDVDKDDYAVAIVLEYAYDSDLTNAINRLVELNPDKNPFDEVATIACDLARTNYISTTAGLRAVQALQTFYQLQGRESCADSLIPAFESPQVIDVQVPTETPTLPPPPPSKTPIPNNFFPTQSSVVVAPTTVPRVTYEGRVFNTFCDTDVSGVIEVYVRQIGSTQGIAGEIIRVRWDGGDSRFVTGLKTERDPGYADFQMEEGVSYIVSMPGRSDPLPNPIVAEPCLTESGDVAITTYQISFIQN